MTNFSCSINFNSEKWKTFWDDYQASMSKPKWYSLQNEKVYRTVLPIFKALVTLTLTALPLILTRCFTPVVPIDATVCFTSGLCFFAGLMFSRNLHRREFPNDPVWKRNQLEAALVQYSNTADVREINRYMTKEWRVDLAKHYIDTAKEESIIPYFTQSSEICIQNDQLHSIIKLLEFIKNINHNLEEAQKKEITDYLTNFLKTITQENYPNIDVSKLQTIKIIFNSSDVQYPPSWEYLIVQERINQFIMQLEIKWDATRNDIRDDLKNFINENQINEKYQKFQKIRDLTYLKNSLESKLDSTLNDQNSRHQVDDRVLDFLKPLLSPFAIKFSSDLFLNLMKSHFDGACRELSQNPVGECPCLQVFLKLFISHQDLFEEGWNQELSVYMKDKLATIDDEKIPANLKELISPVE
ncbi:MAG: hypothetical protein Tsb0021_12100 [Chlamydiales bacterium]